MKSVSAPILWAPLCDAIKLICKTIPSKDIAGEVEATNQYNAWHHEDKKAEQDRNAGDTGESPPGIEVVWFVLSAPVYQILNPYNWLKIKSNSI